MPRRRPHSPDPLSDAISPPPDESAPQRAARLQAEANAKKVSDAIDAELSAEEVVRRRDAKHEVKVLLLGQAESGKSTLRKQFQLQWASRTLDAERRSWGPVVILNVVRCLSRLFDQLDRAFDHIENPDSDRATSYSRGSSPGSTGHGYASSFGGATLDPGVLVAREELLYLRESLLPLLVMEDTLVNSLSHIIVHAVDGVYFRSDWQAHARGTSSPELNSARARAEQDVTTVLKTLASLRDFIRELWRHPYLPVLLKARRIKLEDSTAYFLSAVDRISAPDYLATDADILHVRLQTIGVSEHKFDVNLGGNHVRWLLFDVGGARGLRHTWAPYFDDASAILFLAPISAFDQYLEEAPKVNRLDDSLQIFSDICTNKLLKKAHLILLLNKTDLLRQKLEAGIRIKKFITSYGDRMNTYEEAAQYFRAHFLQAHRKGDEFKRTLYTHFATVIDTKATKKIIYNVADSILKEHIRATGLV